MELGRIMFVSTGEKAEEGGSKNPQTTERQRILRWGRRKILIAGTP